MAEKEKEENFARVIEFPKEVRVYGQISQVYFEGKDKFTTLVIEQNKQPTTSDAEPKKKKHSKEPVLIVPIKQEDSEIHFVKVPLQKLSKIPKARKVGDTYSAKISTPEDPAQEERITEYSANLKEFCKKEKIRTSNDFDTCFVFQQSDAFRKNLLSGTNLPIADVFRFQDKSSPEAGKMVLTQHQEPFVKTLMEIPQPPLRKKPSVREAQTNTGENERLISFLVSPRKPKKKKKSK